MNGLLLTQDKKLIWKFYENNFNAMLPEVNASYFKNEFYFFFIFFYYKTTQND